MSSMDGKSTVFLAAPLLLFVLVFFGMWCFCLAQRIFLGSQCDNYRAVVGWSEVSTDRCYLYSCLVVRCVRMIVIVCGRPIVGVCFWWNITRVWYNNEIVVIGKGFIGLRVKVSYDERVFAGEFS